MSTKEEACDEAAHFEDKQGKRKRAAPSRHDDYAVQEEEAPEKKVARPVVPRKKPISLAPKVKITVTQPIAERSREEQNLLNKYTALRELRAAIRSREREVEGKEPEVPSEEATQAALAALKAMQDEERKPHAPPSRRGPSKRGGKEDGPAAASTGSESAAAPQRPGRTSPSYGAFSGDEFD